MAGRFAGKLPPMILVVGGAGYIGSHMCKLLRESNEPHVVFDSLENGHRESVAGSDLVVGDLRRAEDLKEVFKRHSIDLVMHFAAYISVGESVRDPGKYFENNTSGVLTLLDVMREFGAKHFVFSSTAAIFGEPQYSPIDEDHPKNPASPYGLSKLFVEQILADYDRAHGMKSVCLRYFNAAGADSSGEIGEDHLPEEHLIPVAIEAAQGKRPMLKIFGTDYGTPDGTCVRDYVHVSDLANAHSLAIKHLRSGADSRNFNLGNGQGFSVRQVIDTVRTVTGLNVPFEESDRRPGDPATLIAGSNRIKSELGWSPQYDKLEDIVETAWKWHQAHPKGYA